MISTRWCGTCARSAAPGLAVPMSMPRYTSAESIDTISSGRRSASRSASADLPLAVGPRSATTVRAKLAPAGDVEQRAGDVGGLVRGQPEDGARDLLGFSRSLQGRGGADPVDARRVAAHGVDLGADHAGAHRVDADALRPDFLRKADGEGVYRALRGRVVHVVARAAEARGRRGKVDDRAAFAAVARRHALDRLARAQEAAGDVDRQHALDALGRHAFHARAAIDDAGVVDQRADAAELLVHGPEHAHHVVLARDIALNRNALDRPRQLLRR